MEKTLFLIKPPPEGIGPEEWRTMVENVLARHVGIYRELLAERELTLTEAQVRDLYPSALAKLEARDPAYAARMVAYMTGGPCRLYVLSMPDAAAKVREAVGATASRDAKPGTVRQALGNREVVYENACHASDSEADASRELFALAPDLWAEVFG